MSEFQVVSKAKDLAIHTFKLTSNCNHFPKKFRFSLVDKMQNKSLEIYESLFEANELNLASNRSEREALQTKAVNYCDELLFFIELSMELDIINSNSSEYWTKNGYRCEVDDIKNGERQIRPE